MDVSKLKMMNMLSTGMMYNSQRQAIINENIASADIPGYKRKDMDKASYFDSLVSNSIQGLSTTHPKHISTRPISNSLPITQLNTDVALDMEALELTKNNGEFSQAAATYKKMLTIIRESLGNR